MPRTRTFCRHCRKAAYTRLALPLADGDDQRLAVATGVAVVVVHLGGDALEVLEQQMLASAAAALTCSKKVGWEGRWEEGVREDSRVVQRRRQVDGLDEVAG